jgi:hypothetical protein
MCRRNIGPILYQCGHSGTGAGYTRCLLGTQFGASITASVDADRIRQLMPRPQYSDSVVTNYINTHNHSITLPPEPRTSRNTSVAICDDCRLQLHVQHIARLNSSLPNAHGVNHSNATHYSDVRQQMTSSLASGSNASRPLLTRQPRQNVLANVSQVPILPMTAHPRSPSRSPPRSPISEARPVYTNNSAGIPRYSRYRSRPRSHSPVDRTRSVSPTPDHLYSPFDEHHRCYPHCGTHPCSAAGHDLQWAQSPFEHQ